MHTEAAQARSMNLAAAGSVKRYPPLDSMPETTAPNPSGRLPVRLATTTSPMPSSGASSSAILSLGASAVTMPIGVRKLSPVADGFGSGFSGLSHPGGYPPMRFGPLMRP